MSGRELARWATPAGRRGMADAIREAITDLTDVAAGWQWGRGVSVPRSAVADPAAAEAPGYDTAWARSLPIRALREVVQVAVLNPLLGRQVSLEVHGVEELGEFDEPVLLVANHSSHLDTAAVLATLPASRRRRTVVATAVDDGTTRWRAGGSAIAFHALPIERPDQTLASTAGELLAAGWTLIVYPEGSRSADGFVGVFGSAAAQLAVEKQVRIVPVGLRGSYAAMPRGRAWPTPGRPRVSVRYGSPIRPGDGESVEQLTSRVGTAVQQLIAEDATSWWAVRRSAGVPALDAPTASWRRIWEQSAELPPNCPARPRIWRG